MATREGDNLIQQIGVQSLFGTKVDATKIFSGMMIDIGDDLVTKQGRSHGYKNNTYNVIHKHSSVGSFSGPGSYVELCYPLAGLMPYTVTTASSVSTWNFLPNARAADTPTFFSLECGDDFDTELFKDLTFSSLNINWGLEDITYDGACFSKKKDVDTLTDLTTGATQLAERIIESSDVDVFFNDTFGAIGTTKLPNSFDAKLSISEKWKKKWTLNSANARDYAEAYEQIVDVVLTLLVEADADGIALRSYLLNNTGKFVRISSVSDTVIAGGVFYQFLADMFVKLRGIKEQKNYDGGIYAYEFTLGAEYNSEMGRAMSMQIKNALTAL